MNIKGNVKPTHVKMKSHDQTQHTSIHFFLARMIREGKKSVSPQDAIIGVKNYRKEALDASLLFRRGSREVTTITLLQNQHVLADTTKEQAEKHARIMSTTAEPLSRFSESWEGGPM